MPCGLVPCPCRHQCLPTLIYFQIRSFMGASVALEMRQYKQKSTRKIALIYMCVKNPSTLANALDPCHLPSALSPPSANPFLNPLPSLHPPTLQCGHPASHCCALPCASNWEPQQDREQVLGRKCVALPLLGAWQARNVSDQGTLFQSLSQELYLHFTLWYGCSSRCQNDKSDLGSHKVTQCHAVS